MISSTHTRTRFVLYELLFLSFSYLRTAEMCHLIMFSSFSRQKEKLTSLKKDDNDQTSSQQTQNTKSTKERYHHSTYLLHFLFLNNIYLVSISLIERIHNSK
jgi:hypothetical protein